MIAQTHAEVVTQPNQDFGLLTVQDVEDFPEIEWLLPQVLPSASFAVLYGDPGCGKTFIALSMALSCAAGLDWLGRPTTECKVLYIAAEGIGGFQARVAAYRHRRGLNADNIRFVGRSLQVANSEQRMALLNSLQSADFRPNLIVLDTLARCSEGIDENSAKEMGRVISGVEHLRSETDAALLLVHHTGKNGNSERGSSALRGAADVMILCERSEVSGGLVKLTCEKMKDDEPFPPIGASLEKVHLPSGKSSLVVCDPVDIIAQTGKDADTIIAILREQSTDIGLKAGQIMAAYVAKTGKSESAFARAWRVLKNTDRVVRQHTSSGIFIRAASVGVSSVSNDCQTANSI